LANGQIVENELEAKTALLANLHEAKTAVFGKRLRGKTGEMRKLGLWKTMAKVTSVLVKVQCRLWKTKLTICCNTLHNRNARR
jgi:hypothetical protein